MRFLEIVGGLLVIALVVAGVWWIATSVRIKRDRIK